MYLKLKKIFETPVQMTVINHKSVVNEVVETPGTEKNTTTVLQPFGGIVNRVVE